MSHWKRLWIAKLVSFGRVEDDTTQYLIALAFEKLAEQVNTHLVLDL